MEGVKGSRRLQRTTCDMIEVGFQSNAIEGILRTCCGIISQSAGGLFHTNYWSNKLFFLFTQYIAAI